MGRFSQYRKFNSHQKAVDWGLTWLNSQEDSVFQTEKEKRRFYDELGALTGSYYKIINRVLLGDTDYNNIEEIRAQIDILKAGISSFTIPEDIVVYRATRPIFMKALFNGSRPRRGAVYQYPAFLHTSLTFKTAWEFAWGQTPRYKCFMKIFIPKGCRGIFVDPSRTGCLSEQEIILLPDCKLKVEMVLPGYYECAALL